MTFRGKVRLFVPRYPTATHTARRAETQDTHAILGYYTRGRHPLTYTFLQRLSN